MEPGIYLPTSRTARPVLVLDGEHFYRACPYRITTSKRARNGSVGVLSVSAPMSVLREWFSDIEAVRNDVLTRPHAYDVRVFNPVCLRTPKNPREFEPFDWMEQHEVLSEFAVRNGLLPAEVIEFDDENRRYVLNVTMNDLREAESTHAD